MVSRHWRNKPRYRQVTFSISLHTRANVWSSQVMELLSRYHTLELLLFPAVPNEFKKFKRTCYPLASLLMISSVNWSSIPGSQNGEGVEGGGTGSCMLLRTIEYMLGQCQSRTQLGRIKFQHLYGIIDWDMQTFLLSISFIKSSLYIYLLY